MRGSAKVTAAERETIRRLTVAGHMPQQQIADKLRRTRHTIWKIQKELRLCQRVANREPLSENTKKKLVAMLRQNAGRIRIARDTGITVDKIDKIARSIRFRRRRGSVGCAYRLSPSEVRAIRRAVTQSERRLCKKFHISREWLRHFRVGSFSRRHQ